MGRAVGLVGVMIVLLIGGYLYTKQIKNVTPGGTTPTTTIDVTAVRNDLLAIAEAERRYWASNAKYASLDELRKGGDISIPTRANYTYSADASENNFKIIATYTGPDPKAPKSLTIDESMALTSQ